MNRIYLVCIDDQPEVLNALEQDLELFEDYLTIESCENATEALELIDEIDANGDYLALVISDQVMPEMTGVDLLSQLKKDGRFPNTQKILLTGLATHNDTIDAINQGGLDYYIQKPWEKEQLASVLKKSLVKYVLAKGIEYQPLLPVLDQEVLYATLRTKS